MKLLSCFIYGFGKLRNFRVDFNGDLTSICSQNGSGKTTLAVFLKTMFYGMETCKANSNTLKERAHYLPFDGGKYGGNVTFEYTGRKYTVERVFDKKSDTKDILNVTWDIHGTPDLAGLKCAIGEQIFGINRDAFERTIFVTNQEIDLISTESIKTKLNNFVEGSDDDTNLQAALSRLSTRAKDYSKSGGKSLIDLEKAKAANLRNEIANRDNIKRALAPKYDELNGYTREIAEISAYITAAQTENVVRADWERYDAMVDEAQACRERADDIASKYPGDVPSQEDCDTVKKCLAAIRTEQAVQQKKAFTGEDESALQTLTAKFGRGVPTPDTINAVRADIGKAQTIEAGLDTIKKASPSREEQTLNERFDSRPPKDETLSTLAEYEKQYKSADDAYNGTADFTVSGSPVPAAKQDHRLNIILLIVAAVLIVAGIGVCFALLAAGIVLLVLGVLVLILDGFLYLNKKSSAGHAEGPALNPDKQKYREKRDTIASSIGAIIMPYGYSFSDGVLFASSTFRSDVQKYRSFRQEAADKAASIAEKQRQLNDLCGKLKAYFDGYGIVGDSFADCLTELSNEMNRYTDLMRRRTASDNDEKTSADNIRKFSNAVRSFCAKYGLQAEGISARMEGIESDAETMARELNSYYDKMNDAEEFKNKKGLVERPAGGAVDIGALNEQLSDLQGKKSNLAYAISGDERDVESWKDLESDLAASEERLNKYNYNLHIINETMKSLQLADDRLKDKYANPTSTSFAKYGQILQQTAGDRIYMTRDLNVRFQHNGVERGEEYLSSGQRAACALCFRLAMIDNMYAAEKPFIILDDPFTSMDARNFAQAAALLKKLSQEIQIVYLTCHESRIIQIQ